MIPKENFLRFCWRVNNSEVWAQSIFSPSQTLRCLICKFRFWTKILEKNPRQLSQTKSVYVYGFVHLEDKSIFILPHHGNTGESQSPFDWRLFLYPNQYDRHFPQRSRLCFWIWFKGRTTSPVQLTDTLPCWAEWKTRCDCANNDGGLYWQTIPSAPHRTNNPLPNALKTSSDTSFISRVSCTLENETPCVPPNWSPMTNYMTIDQIKTAMLWHSTDRARARDVKGERHRKACSNNVNGQDWCWGVGLLLHPQL